MDNLDFLKKILMSEAEYWIVAKRNEYHGERHKDSIMLIAIPINIRRGLKYDDIMLKDLEALQRVDLPNIFINEPYAPFQHGQTLYNVYNGYPVEGSIHQFMIDALALKSNDVWDYYDKLLRTQKEEVLN